MFRLKDRPSKAGGELVQYISCFGPPGFLNALRGSFGIDMGLGHASVAERQSCGKEINQRLGPLGF